MRHRLGNQMFKSCLLHFRVTTMTMISRCEIRYYVTLWRFGMLPALFNDTTRNSSWPTGSFIQPNLSLSDLLYLLPTPRHRLSDTLQNWHPSTTLFLGDLNNAPCVSNSLTNILRCCRISRCYPITVALLEFECS